MKCRLTRILVGVALITAFAVQGCTSQTTSEWTFKNKEMTANVIAALKRQGIPFEVINETKIVVPVEFSSNVKKEIAFADTSSPSMYTLANEEKKDLYTSRLTANGIKYRESHTETGDYVILIDGKYRRTAHELYLQITRK